MKDLKTSVLATIASLNPQEQPKNICFSNLETFQKYLNRHSSVIGGFTARFVSYINDVEDDTVEQEQQDKE